MPQLHKLEEIFTHFPGIGPRQAKRFVYYLMTRSPAFIGEFLRLVQELQASSRECHICHRLFMEKIHGKKTSEICNICSDVNRDKSILMIVARDSDLENIERSGAYSGLYFILGGMVPILDEEPEKRIRLKALLDHTKKHRDQFKEIIISLSTTAAGEHTTDLIVQSIRDTLGENKIPITLLGRGLSTGAEIEYADGATIDNALKGRTKLAPK